MDLTRASCAGRLRHFAQTFRLRTQSHRNTYASEVVLGATREDSAKGIWRRGRTGWKPCGAGEERWEGSCPTVPALTQSLRLSRNDRAERCTGGVSGTNARGNHAAKTRRDATASQHD